MELRHAAALAFVVCAVSLPASRAGAADKPEPRHAPTVKVSLRLEIDGQANLKPEDVKYAVFPSGKRCAFTFFGARSPETIEVLTKLGFRTTVYTSPSASPASLKALEKAGADIGINIWGGKGGYASHIEGNTVQEAYDAVATSRMVMRKSCAGPLGAGAIGGHYSTWGFPLNRDADKGDGCGFTYHDSNYLILSDNKPYMVYLGRDRDPPLMNRENFDNRMDSQNVPNEIIYYQILANQFRGTLRRAAKGQIVRFSLRDFRAPDLAECADVIGSFGKHQEIWNASETEIGANEMIQQKVHVEEVKSASGGAEIVLGVEQDTFMPYVLTPLPIQLPKGLKVRKAVAAGVDCPVVATADGVYVDVPLREVLRGGLEMTFKTSAPDMSVPEQMPVELTIRNTSKEAIAGARLRWVDNISFAVSGGEDAAFDLPAGGEKVIQAVAKTSTGARFGITPFQAIVTAGAGETARTLMESFEIVVAPMLRLDMDPSSTISLFKGRSQFFLVHIDNRKSTAGGAPNVLISHRAGPCKGTVTFDLPPQMRVEPTEQPFELAANDAKTLVFKVTNDAWSDEIGMVAPVIKLAGSSEPLTVPFPGTRWLRKQSQIDYKPLDDKGLLAYASWDDTAKGGHFDKSVGPSGAYYYPGHTAAYNNEGVKGWCMNSQRVCQLHEVFKNIDYYEGTMCTWVRKDPFVRNENTYVPDPAETARMGAGRGNAGETLITVGGGQRLGSASTGMTLRRFRSWRGKPGYLQLTYQLMGRRLIYCQAEPFEWSETWRHVAILWSAKDRRLEIYLDGKLAAKADPGPLKEWYTTPWDPGASAGHDLVLITSDHGAWCGTGRDEVYIYNRAMTAEEIMANKKAAEK